MAPSAAIFEGGTRLFRRGLAGASLPPFLAAVSVACAHRPVTLPAADSAAAGGDAGLAQDGGEAGRSASGDLVAFGEVAVSDGGTSAGADADPDAESADGPQDVSPTEVDAQTPPEANTTALDTIAPEIAAAMDAADGDGQPDGDGSVNDSGAAAVDGSGDSLGDGGDLAIAETSNSDLPAEPETASDTASPDATVISDSANDANSLPAADAADTSTPAAADAAADLEAKADGQPASDGGAAVQDVSVDSAANMDVVVGDVTLPDGSVCLLKAPEPTACKAGPAYVANACPPLPDPPKKLGEFCLTAPCTHGLIDALGKCAPMGPVSAGVACAPDGNFMCTRHVCDGAGKCVAAFAPAGSYCEEHDYCGERQCDGKGTCVVVKPKTGKPCQKLGANTDCSSWYCDANGECADGKFQPAGKYCGAYSCIGQECDGKGNCVADRPVPGNYCYTANGQGVCQCDGQCKTEPQVGCSVPGQSCGPWGSFCIKGVCQDDLTCKLTILAGQVCNTKEPCFDWLCSDTGVCEKANIAVGASCGANYGCHVKTCDCKGQCVWQDAPLGTACAANFPPVCNLGSSGTCQAGGVCAATAADEGAPCNTQCGKGQCTAAGRCALPNISAGQTIVLADLECSTKVCNEVGEVSTKYKDGKDCPAASQCTIGKCSNGYCQQVPAASGTACVLNGACVLSASCDGKGNCVAQGDVGKPCVGTDDCMVGACDAASVCVTKPLPNGTPCGQPVTGPCQKEGKCMYGKCTQGKAGGCDDGNWCTQDWCENDQCNNTPMPDKYACPMPDGNDICLQAQCMSGGCMVGFGKGNSGGSCNDGNPCTVQDKCFMGTCMAGNSPYDLCTDGDPCTKDSCDPKVAGGCVHTSEADGTPCGSAGLATCQCGLCMWK